MKDIIRYGVISSVNPEICAARVTFEDKDNLVSAELPILQSACANNQFYSLPDVGDNVVCLVTSNDPNGMSGFIIGSFYTEKNLPPAQIQEISCIRFGDGTEIKYDRESHELSINCVGNIKINGKRIDLNE
ncbi:MAG: phage baseplate assembly protein V [Selenomonadaceae bacterium]|nr:phage baseplate assembly protein V [Selenomonadaceae bacterium]